MPFYAVRKELENKSLVSVSAKDFPEQKFGVWLLRERKNLSRWIEKASKWLEQQALG